MTAGTMEIPPQELAAHPGGLTLVDVREDWEVQRCPFPGAVHIPLGQLASLATAELDPAWDIITICHHGVRSLHAALTLKGLGFSRVRSLQGGTDLWARSVDPAMPRY